MNLLLSRNRFISLLIVILCCGFFSQTEAQQSRRKPVVSEVRFDAGNSARGIPFELHNNHIYLSVKVVNSEPLSFILDTGASSIISRKRAESLGLKFRGKEKGFGVGENSVEASFVEGVSLNLSGATLSRQKIAAVDLEGLQKSLGRAVDGILGYSFFSRFVVEIDYAAKTINLYSPKSYRYKGKGERIPIIVDAESGLIFTRAVVEPSNRAPIKGLFEIDSGGGHALVLNKPFVERNNLLTASQKANAISVGGIDGSSRAVAGKVEKLQVGRSLVKNVNTLFSLATGGMLANEEFDGNIGNDFLRRFKVVFDYSRRLMILESDTSGAT
jgi:predicted aspartyl protease